MKKASENIINSIATNEGLRLRAYKCPAGVWTIGYGHTSGVKPADVITKEQAFEFLKVDLKWAEDEVNKQLPDINQNQFDALVSFVFNVGVGNLRKSTLLKKAKADPNDKTISLEFAKWNKGGGKVLPGLVRRRKEESDLYFKTC